MSAFFLFLDAYFYTVYLNGAVSGNQYVLFAVNDLGFDSVGVFRVYGDFDLRCNHFELLCFYKVAGVEGVGAAQLPLTFLVK